MKSKIRSKEERKTILKSCKESGFTAKEFCELEGINLATFYSWRKEFSKEEIKSTFIQLKPVSEITQNQNSQIRLQKNDINIYLESNINISTLKKVIECLS